MAEQQHENLNDEMRQTEERLENTVIPIIEERAVINKNIVETGKVRISKRVSEHEEIIDEPLLREEVSVERVAINKFVDAPPEIRHEGDTMIIPIVEEQEVIEKRLVLVEELHIKKQIIEEHKPQRVSLLKEEVKVFYTKLLLQTLSI